MAWNRKKRLSLIPEAQAGPIVADTYFDIRTDLNLPSVPAYHRALANYPKFLAHQWKALHPLVRDKAFAGHTERLRAEAYTTMHNYFRIPDLMRSMQQAHLSDGARQELTNSVDFYQYRDAALLLLTAVQSVGFESAPADASPPCPAPLALGAHEDQAKPVLVPEENASPAVRAIYEDIRRTLSIPVVTDDYLAMARFPDFIQEYWKALKPNAIAPLFGEYARRMGDSAANHAAELPPVPQLSVQCLEDAGISKDDIASVVHINEAFCTTYAASVLNIAFARIGLDGGNGLDFGPQNDNSSRERERSAA